MIVIFVALYAEAKPIIDMLGLKKCPNFSILDSYISKDEDIMLIITGVGPINAATGVAYTLGYLQGGEILKDKSSIFVLNIGVCGASNSSNIETGELLLVNKLVDAVSKKTFYPDMIISNDNREAKIISSYELYKQDRDVISIESQAEFQTESAKKSDETRKIVTLYDCEAAYIYQSAIKYVSNHQMGFIKIVSDFGDTESITKEYISELISNKRDSIVNYVDTVRRWLINNVVSSNDVYNYMRIDSDNEKFDSVNVEKIGQDLKCSETMLNDLKHLYRYCQLSGNNIQKEIDHLYENASIPVTHKKDGKRIIDELKKQFTT